ncbi:Hypothetical protein A7982_05965 [Minicystis rosea]|nr:Hypothetical protein A7982_05965 [Minicystis rosea]
MQAAVPPLLLDADEEEDALDDVAPELLLALVEGSPLLDVEPVAELDPVAGAPPLLVEAPVPLLEGALPP